MNSGDAGSPAGFHGTRSSQGRQGAVCGGRGDVILVVAFTINYRLGVFEFFVHPELTKDSGVHASGNDARAEE